MAEENKEMLKDTVGELERDSSVFTRETSIETYFVDL